jgi:hypothetical protein
LGKCGYLEVVLVCWEKKAGRERRRKACGGEINEEYFSSI